MDSGQTGRLSALADGCYPFGFVGELKAMYTLAWPTVCVDCSVGKTFITVKCSIWCICVILWTLYSTVNFIALGGNFDMLLLKLLDSSIRGLLWISFHW